MSETPDQLRFKDWLQRIDQLLDQYDPGELDPNLRVRDVMERRATQRPLLEQVVELATAALLEFPRNSELLRRRAFARCRIVSDDLQHPQAAEGIEDLNTVMAFDPDGLRPGIQLVNELFTFSAMSNEDVAELAAELARRAEFLMLEGRVLQVRALVHAERMIEARNVAQHWLELFPECEELDAALREITDLRGTVQ